MQVPHFHLQLPYFHRFQGLSQPWEEEISSHRERGLRGGYCVAKRTAGLELLCWVITTQLRCYKLNCKEQTLLLGEGR